MKFVGTSQIKIRHSLIKIHLELHGLSRLQDNFFLTFISLGYMCIRMSYKVWKYLMIYDCLSKV